MPDRPTPKQLAEIQQRDNAVHSQSEDEAVNQLLSDRHALLAELGAVTAERNRLLEAMRYGDHQDNCDVQRRDEDLPCSCGWKELRRSIVRAALEARDAR